MPLPSITRKDIHDVIFSNKNFSNNEKKKVVIKFLCERFKFNQQTVNSIDLQAIDVIKQYLESHFFNK